MTKTTIRAISVLFLTFSTALCYAQSTNPNVMTPQQFQSTVSSMGKQTETKLEQDLQKRLNKKLPAHLPGGQAARSRQPAANPQQPARPAAPASKPAEPNIYTGYGPGTQKPASSGSTGKQLNIQY